ncbi:MAG: sensor histidine kinase, partial [Aurantimicrobium sp.]
AGHQFSLKVGIAYSGLIFAVVVLAPLLHFDALNFASVIGPAIGGLFAFGISRGYLQLLHSAREREELLASLQSAQLEFLLLQDELAVTQRESGAIEERTRIARDLHDTIAQSLTSIRLLAHASTSQVDASQAIMTLQHIETIAKESLVDVRKILDELVPAELENTQIVIAIQNMLERLRQEFGVQFELHIDSELPKIRADVEVALLRTTQSALANIRLHSRANRIVVELFNRSNQLRLTISDNGVGFDTADWETSPTKESQKFGLRLMRDRLRELGGSLSINSSPETGTSVSVSLPSALSHSNSK